MPHIIAVGVCYLDTILTIPHYPPEDAKLRSTALSRRRGGNCPNSLEVLSQLASDSNPPPILSLLAILPSPDSPATRELRASLPAVDTSLSLFRSGYTEPASCYVLRSEATGSRTIVNFNELPEMTVREFVGKVGEVGGEHGKGEGFWWHFEGRIPDVTVECVRYLRACAPAARISVEAENPTREGLEDVVALADVVFYSKSWAVNKGFVEGDNMRDFLEAQALRTKKGALLCLTWGSQGAAALDGRTSKFEYVDGWKPDGQVLVDTIGAGDTFVAGMLFCENTWGTSWPLKKKLAFANELAGRKVLQEGFVGLGFAMKDRVKE